MKGVSQKANLIPNEFWALHSEALVISVNKRLFAFRIILEHILSVFSISIVISPQKSKELPHQVVAP